jgi:hypothetical protein
MSRLVRGLVIGASISFLLAGAALAGPTRTDGDPDRPQITHPDLPHLQAVVNGVRGNENKGATPIGTQVAPGNWKLFLRTYLQLIRVFSL